MNEERLGQLIEGAYDAAVEGQWYEWLEQLRQQMSAAGGMLAHLGSAGIPVRSLPVACGGDLVPELVHSYLERRRQDPWYCQVRRQRNNVITLDARMRRLRARSALADLYQGLNCHYHTGAVLSGGHGHFLLALHRAPGQEDFGAEQQQMLSCINQHLRQAMALTPMLFELVQGRLLADKLNDTQVPQAVVRANGVPAFVNEAMANYLRGQGQPFRFHRGKLGGRQPFLDRLIERAQNRLCQSGVAACQAVTIPLGQQDLSLMPLPPQVLEGATLWQIR
ncbi:hypothetical protein GCM10025772_10890 [Ferrimonas gelatinilytica]|uniref:Uncharacterized protein n=2 Tax=Ferrimonas gelatinilytica TaxID=1255257 RepID=A0ABP9RZU5_9GAMM